MNQVVSYRPFRTYNWVIPFVSGIGMFYFICFGYSLFRPDWYLGTILLMGILCSWLSKVLHDFANIVVLFEQDGLRIIGEKNNIYQYFSWDVLEYAYYARSYKGHLFLVLSPRELSQKEVRTYSNRGAISSRMCVDSLVIIYIDASQNTTLIKAVVSDRVKYRTEDGF